MTQSAESSGVFLSLRWRILLVFALVFMTALAAVFLWFDTFTTNLAIDNLKRDLRATASSAAVGIDGDQYSRLVQSGRIDDADYEEISAYLRSVKGTNPKAAGMYTYIQQPGEDFVRFVVSAALPPGIAPSARDELISQNRPPGCQIPPSSRPDFKEAYKEATPAMFVGLNEPSNDDESYTDDWGTWWSGFAPITNSAGESVGAVGVDMCAADIERLHSNIQKVIWPVFGGVSLTLAFAVLLIAYRMTRPIVRLTRSADAIAQGNYDEPVVQKNPRVRDEVDTLASVFAMMVEKVRQRETQLKQQVAELQIMVDETKRQKQVSEIVDSDFFRDLQQKAREARARRDRSNESPES